MAFESKAIKSDASTTIATIAVDTVSGVDYPVSQIIVGADGAAKTIVSGTTGLPVTGVYSEDVATPNPIVGQAMLMERDDALSTLTPAEGDWAGMRCDANGALWVSLSATDNAVLDAMVVDLAALEVLQTSTNTKLDTLEATLSAIETDQAAIEVLLTAANVDHAAIEVLLGTIDADTGAIKTAVEVIDNAISGSEMQVDVVASLPTGSNTIGTVNLSATDNAVLDTIDAVLDTIKTDTASSLTALQLIDDAVYTDGSGTPSKGVLMMGSDTTNPQALLCSPTGIGYRTIVTSDGSYSPVFQDDAAINNEAVMLAGFVFDDGSPDSVDEGDAGYVRMSANRNLYVNIRDNAGNERGLNIDASGNLSAKLGANSGVDIGDVDVTSIVPGTAATNLGKAQDSAAGGTDTGVAAMAIRDDEVATLGADGDYVNLVADEFRRLRVTNMPSSTSEVKFAKIDGASSGDNTLVAAAGGGIKIRVLQYVIVSAGTVNVRFESGASGTALTGQMNLVANTGVSAPFCPEGLFETADNTLLNMELSDAVSVDGHLTYVEI